MAKAYTNTTAPFVAVTNKKNVIIQKFFTVPDSVVNKNFNELLIFIKILFTFINANIIVESYIS